MSADAATGGIPPVKETDIVIVGGGPIGLMLACELRLAGADPVLLERLPEISEIPKGNGLVGHSVPMLDHRGLLERCWNWTSPISKAARCRSWPYPSAA